MDLITAALIMGFAGSFHCVGMCGPIAFALPLNRTNNLTKSVGILFYNFGRISTYVIIGTLLGVFGKGLKLAGILQYVSITIGIVIILSVVLPSLMKKISFTSSYYLKFNNWVKAKLGKFLVKKSNTSLLILGLLNGLLPCGLVWVAMVGSIAYGSISSGALFMLFFGLGTFPMMFALPYFSSSISATFRNRMTKAIPYVMIVFGIVFILRGLNLDIPYVSPPLSEDGTEVKSCCHH